MGRKAKEKLSIREQEDSVIEKYLSGAPMTLKEASLALYMYDKAHPIPGKKLPKKPMTEMGFLKLETRILQKLRSECEKAGLTWDEVREYFCGKNRKHADTKYAHESVDSWN